MIFWISGRCEHRNIDITITITITVGEINSRMTSYLKIFVLIDFPFEDAIFPFNRGTAT